MGALFHPEGRKVHPYPTKAVRPDRFEISPSPFDMDGWRVDVANMTGRMGGQDLNHDVARRLRAAMARNKPDALLIVEHCHYVSGDLDGDGWYSTMNYSGFTNPIWSWLGSRRCPLVGAAGSAWRFSLPRVGDGFGASHAESIPKGAAQAGVATRPTCCWRRKAARATTNSVATATRPRFESTW